MRSLRAPRRVVVAALAIALVVVAGLWYAHRSSGRTITAYFTSAASLYAGNPVEVLGVPVGKVTSVSPQPDRVKVEISIRDDVKLPADVHALQVSPSLISGRSLTLAPAYKGGAELADHAVIPVERTEVPLDVNDLFRSANGLAKALGPKGANKTGSLTRLLRVMATNLKGNGSGIANAIRDLGSATGTLSDSRTDLTGTVRGLQAFVTTLADHDGGMRELNTQLATVTGSLAGDRDDLGAALKQLSRTLGNVAGFVRENRAGLRANVNRLSRVSRVLVRERAILGQVLDEAPTGLSNLSNSYNAAGGTLDVRMDLNELSEGPGALLCTLVERGTPGSLPKSLSDACAAFVKAIDGNGAVPSLADLLAALQGNGSQQGQSTSGGAR